MRSLGSGVVAVVQELLLTRGLRGVTTDEVARRAHISKKTLYQLFPSKEELLRAALWSLLESSLARLDAILDSARPPLAKLWDYFAALGDIVSRVELRLMEEVRYLYPSIWDVLEAERKKRMERIATLVRECQAEGMVREDIDVELWLLFLQAAVEGAMNPETLLKRGFSSNKALEIIRKVFLEGILTPKGREATVDPTKEEP